MSEGIGEMTEETENGRDEQILTNGYDLVTSQLLEHRKRDCVRD